MASITEDAARRLLGVKTNVTLLILEFASGGLVLDCWLAEKVSGPIGAGREMNAPKGYRCVASDPGTKSSSRSPAIKNSAPLAMLLYKQSLSIISGPAASYASLSITRETPSCGTPVSRCLRILDSTVLRQGGLHLRGYLYAYKDG
jgi:hypothetical protein